ncbi:hypothetical protein PCANC_06791 [Puccinia coronata f. sp. avenae]|uniref:RNase H type-1 domain-containing protein n=1 Tax=Puccinia coronata f. sp. avenae TaxID=200324 RepID=A0A2N5UU92_9BASI|nr:hypothetical protein PCANC_06791 [Puccinia coronata f. sp. avenae]
MDIFSDGSSKMHNGSRAAGIGVYCRDPVPLRISEPIFSTSNTNNEAEWIALAVSVAWVVEAKNANTNAQVNADHKEIVTRVMDSANALSRSG